MTSSSQIVTVSDMPLSPYQPELGGVRYLSGRLTCQKNRILASYRRSKLEIGPLFTLFMHKSLDVHPSRPSISLAGCQRCQFQPRWVDGGNR
jgi:hypothetical protein